MAQVRRFNRTVTQRVGALHDHYLARDRPLGEARLLWEIGPDGCDVRLLRSRLDLDSGYLSRLLRALEAEGLVTVCRRPGDRRVRTAVLTPTGTRERTLYDRRSDAMARSMLESLSDRDQDRLVEAMARVERLLTAALIDIEVRDPAHPHAVHCLREYFAELDRRFDLGFDPGVSRPATAAEMRPPAGAFLVAALRGEPVGCGGLKFHGDEPAEIKRMWVAPAARGLGVGRRLLRALEEHAAANGARRIRLDTNGSLVEAIAMYRTSGYREVEAYNDEPYADCWFERDLARPAGRRT